MDFSIIGILLIIGVAMYFLMIRPARKQQQKQQQMMNSLEVGSRIMLGSGIYGTIRHLGEKQAVIEISPGVDLTILRAAIRGVVAPEEEEFEYSDETGYSATSDDQGVNPILTNMEAFEQDVASGFAPDAAQATQPDEDAEQPVEDSEDGETPDNTEDLADDEKPEEK